MKRTISYIECATIIEQLNLKLQDATEQLQHCSDRPDLSSVPYLEHLYVKTLRLKMLKVVVGPSKHDKNCETWSCYVNLDRRMIIFEATRRTVFAETLWSAWSDASELPNLESMPLSENFEDAWDFFIIHCAGNELNAIGLLYFMALKHGGVTTAEGLGTFLRQHYVVDEADAEVVGTKRRKLDDITEALPIPNGETNNRNGESSDSDSNDSDIIDIDSSSEGSRSSATK